ncbi:MAG TPA: TonB-dependent receptor [Steroidobacteraceae bacterium]|jgi:outer membrane receptor protein involved in Fe transport|nr:TonB-dependent receptor [Steroidobacteraceae bacterium]
MSSHHSRDLRRAVTLLCGLTAAATTSIVSAQTAPSPDSGLEEVIVTGSRIARPNLESAVPVTTVTADELFETGSTSVGDLLNDLPALRSTFSQSNSSRFLGTAGLNLLDLRGLGTQRTLVLVNGRRHVASDILNNAVSPDTNTFPTDLVERIDVVTGGNSAVYGSDAVAGVVNFILKKDFEGLQFRGQGGQSSESDGGNYYASVLAGTNFWDDRGNIAANFEYAKQDPFFASDRSNLSHQGLFVVVDSDTGADANGSDGTPDRQYYRDVRAVTFSNGGSFIVNPLQSDDPDAPLLTPCGVGTTGTPHTCPFIFQPDGSLVPQTGTRIGSAANGNFDGGNGSNNREYELFGIYPKLDRLSFNVIGNLKISDAFAPFVEAKYVRTKSLNQSGPAFFQGGTIDGDRENPRFDNPFLTDGARATINAALLAGDNDPLSGSDQFSLYKNLSDLGGREEDATRETTRIVLGVGGEIGSGWSYEVSANYGRFKEETEVLGNLQMQRFVLAMDSARDAGGNIVCRSQIDPAAAYALYDDPTTPEVEAPDYTVERLAADIAACAPMNPFGEGNISPAARAYVLQNTTSVAKIDQFDFSASITGDSSAWFSLPAGPVGVAFGVEHRVDSVFFEADALVSSGITFYNALPLLDPPKQKVSEVFTEFRVPLLKEKKGAEELTLNLAARYSDYNGSTGGVLAYNGGIEWAPLPGVRLRAGLARAVRAPSLVDLYSEQSQNFADITDPCAFDNLAAGSPTRAANCAAAGIPTSFNYQYIATPEILSGGNPDLKEETSDSFTAGLVLQPEFLPGFSFSADYFDIEIDDVITAPDAQQIMDACYDAADLNNQFCALFQRLGPEGSPESGPLDAYALENGTLQQTLLNYASSRARGIDFEVAYAHEIGDLGRLSTRLVYTRMLQRDDYLDPAHPSDPDQVLYELGDPKNAFNLNTDFAAGKFKFGYQLRYIGHMTIDLAENVFSVGGNPPQNADFADAKYYPEVFYHDVRAAYDITDDVNAYVGVDNLANRIPPFGLTGAGGGSGIYESRGRFFYAGFKIGF